MAKKTEEITAEKYFIELLKSPEEIALLIGVSPRTVRNWITKNKWKEIRDARINNTVNRAENIKKVIEELTERQLEVQAKIAKAEATGNREEAYDLKVESTRLSQEAGMWQKTLEKFDKDYKISLSAYLEVMEEIFQNLQDYDRDLYLKTLDFQTRLLNKVAHKYA